MWVFDEFLMEYYYENLLFKKLQNKRKLKKNWFCPVISPFNINQSQSFLQYDRSIS